MCISGKLLAFGYTLVRNPTNRKLTCIFRVIPGWQINFREEIEEHYTRVCRLPDDLNIPLNVFKPRRFYINVFCKNKKCNFCSNLLYNDCCFDEKCTNFSIPDFNSIPVFNDDKNEAPLFDIQYVYQNIALQNNKNIAGGKVSCSKCVRCKKCKSLKTRKCFLHVVCKHQPERRYKNMKSLRSNFHKLNELAYYNDQGLL